MNTVTLYSVVGAFTDGKQRPGFFIGDRALVLSSVAPIAARSYIEVPATCVVSDHFKAKGSTVFIVEPSNPCTKYNNAPGGELVLTDEAFKIMLEVFDIEVEARQFTFHV